MEWLALDGDVNGSTLEGRKANYQTAGQKDAVVKVEKNSVHIASFFSAEQKKRSSIESEKDRGGLGD